MKRIMVVGQQLCRTFTTTALVVETNSTMPTVDIDTEREIMEFRRKIAEVESILAQAWWPNDYSQLSL